MCNQKNGFWPHSACTVSKDYSLFFRLRWLHWTEVWGCVFNFAWQCVLLGESDERAEGQGCNVALIKPLFLILTSKAGRVKDNNAKGNDPSPDTSDAQLPLWSNQLVDRALPTLSRLIRVWPSMTEKRSVMREIDSLPTKKGRCFDRNVLRRKT